MGWGGNPVDTRLWGCCPLGISMSGCMGETSVAMKVVSILESLFKKGGLCGD